VTDVVYLGSVNHYVVELDAGPTLTVLRQNLHGSTDQALGRRGQGVTVGWADEHVIDLSGRASEHQHPEHDQLDQHDQEEKS
jgi:putative spermidine/putrescine transport system ATP-binding protein